MKRSASDYVRWGDFDQHVKADPRIVHNIIATIKAGIPDLRVDTNSIYVDSANHRVGIGNSAPAYTLDVTGNIRCSTGFGCNSKNPQTAYASGGALGTYATGAYGVSTEAKMSDLYALVVKIRAALVANGIMS